MAETRPPDVGIICPQDDNIICPQGDNITCPICLEIYNEPHILTGCSHTFCLQCIQQLSTDTVIQCPICRLLTDLVSIQLDNETQMKILASKTTSEIRELSNKMGDKECVDTTLIKSEDAKSNSHPEVSGSSDSSNQHQAVQTQQDQHQAVQIQQDQHQAVQTQKDQHQAVQTHQDQHQAVQTQQNLNQSSHQQINICHVCEMQPFKSHCDDCALFMCDECLFTHSQRDQNKLHTIKSVKEVVQISRSKLQNALNELLAERNNIDKQSAELDQITQRVQLEQKMKLDYLEKITEESISKLMYTQEEMTKKIQEKNDEIVKELEGDLLVYEETMEDLKGKVTYLEQQMSYANAGIICDNMMHVNENIAGEVEKLKEKLPKRDGPLVSPIVITQDETFDPRKILDVVIDHTENDFKLDDDQ